MSNATSIVGTWNGFVTWGDAGPPVSNASTLWTFRADGSWTYEFGGGRWIQVEGLVTWNFTNAAGLIYAANVTRNGLDGIMGYAVAGPSPGTGSFYAVREGARRLEAQAPKGQDMSMGPHKDAGKATEKKAHQPA
jgi:hypothetical protein